MAGSIIRIGFALLKCPHLHKAYLIIIQLILILSVDSVEKRTDTVKMEQPEMNEFVGRLP